MKVISISNIIDDARGNMVNSISNTCGCMYMDIDIEVKLTTDIIK